MTEELKPFPPRVLALLHYVAERNPREGQDVFEDEHGEPMQDVADEALAWIAARELAAPSQPEGAGGKPWDTLTALEKAPKLVAELEAEAERITRYTNGPGDFLLNEAARVLEALSAGAAAPKRCEYCDGTGDVHSIDGEWRGRCTCAAGAAAPDEGDGARYRAFFDAGLPITFMGVEYEDKTSLDAAIDALSAPKGEAATPSSQGGQP